MLSLTYTTDCPENESGAYIDGTLTITVEFDLTTTSEEAGGTSYYFIEIEDFAYDTIMLDDKEIHESDVVELLGQKKFNEIESAIFDEISDIRIGR